MAILHTLNNIPDVGEYVSKSEIVVNYPLQFHLNKFVQKIDAKLTFNDKEIFANIELYEIINNKEIISGIYTLSEFKQIMDDIINVNQNKNIRNFIN
jgi:hypothetical protein